MSKQAQHLNRPRHDKRAPKGWVFLRVGGRSSTGQPNYMLTVPALLAQMILREPAYYYKVSLEDDGRIVFTPTERIPSE